MTKFFVSSVLGLASLHGVMAAPKVYPEVIPGPGMPSLVELNTTTTELYEMGLPEGRDESTMFGTPTFEPRCGPAEYAYTKVDHIISCYNYLRKLGSRTCTAEENTVLCTAGEAHVYGVAWNGHTSSRCDNVAKAVLWAIDNCTRKDKTCAGAQAVPGNENMAAGATHIRW
ncbi:hypothetical protein C7999DRAFT_36055 [Corynascus novoguineensis]|uniref:Secreted protein n=1 Tax=Corynascus novoguineensis TaxID=1126955 RepID=A0AAN7CK63_9PEZI|nr:hypothetical protein C7999DRAFT_36055 [Corynascus novoguineensis]